MLQVRADPSWRDLSPAPHAAEFTGICDTGDGTAGEKRARPLWYPGSAVGSEQHSGVLSGLGKVLCPLLQQYITVRLFEVMRALTLWPIRGVSATLDSRPMSGRHRGRHPGHRPRGQLGVAVARLHPYCRARRPCGRTGCNPPLGAAHQHGGARETLRESLAVTVDRGSWSQTEASQRSRMNHMTEIKA
jgi:hypothetical protein